MSVASPQKKPAGRPKKRQSKSTTSKGSQKDYLPTQPDGSTPKPYELLPNGDVVLNHTSDNTFLEPLDHHYSLDPDNPVHAVLIKIAKMNDRKGADYATDVDPWSNFRDQANHFNIALYEAADFSELQKLSRLKALRHNGRAPANEALEDTYLDKAVYAVLACAMHQEFLKGNLS